jgi:hypothetical protein
MKINKAIHSVNNNPDYLDFWESVSMIWKEKFNVEPILYYFYENFLEEDLEITEKYGKVKRIKTINGIPTAIQVMWSRYFMPSTFPEDVSIICDIDMLPMSEEYFLKQIDKISDNKYVHLNPCISSYGLIPSCYHVATGANFKKYLELPETWEESIFDVVNSGFGKTVSGNELWFADEEYATHKLLKNKDENLILLNRNGGQNGFRIDRDRWHYDEEKILQDYYYDCHSIRPYQKHKREIEKIVKLIMK